MISEESCDTEDSSMAAENSAFASEEQIRAKSTFKYKTFIWNCNNIIGNVTILNVFMINWMQP